MFFIMLNRKITLLLLFLAISMKVAFAAPVACEEGAQMKLLKFLMLDANGGRLKSWDGASYVHQWFDEPGWDEITLIDGYQITRCACSGLRCSFNVEYKLTATSGQKQVIPHDKGGVDLKTFELLKVKGKDWKIKSIEEPRVYWYRHTLPAGAP